jgi:SagB-type dehydrogenase family enzyme
MEMSNTTLPDIKADNPFTNILLHRKSARSFSRKAISPEQMSHLLWACQGMQKDNRRTTPSAGALYPLEIYWADDQQLAHYNPQRHELEGLSEGDLRSKLARAALSQEFIAQAPATMILTAVYERVTKKYGQPRGIRYVDMEAGHAAQNVLLQATVEGLVSVPVGAFHDQQVSEILSLPAGHSPLYLLPLGYIDT